MAYWPSIPSSHRPGRRPVSPRESIRPLSRQHSLRLIGRRQTRPFADLKREPTDRGPDLCFGIVCTVDQEEKMSGCGQESRDGCVSRILSFQLQKSPTPNFEGKCGNSPDISKGVFQSGMCKFESSQVSQPVPPSEIGSPIRGERPANGGLLQFSGRSPYTRFCEI